MGISDPEIQKKVFGPRWEHEIEKQGWPFWKRLMHRLQDCPIFASPNHKLENFDECYRLVTSTILFNSFTALSLARHYDKIPLDDDGCDAVSDFRPARQK